jgi:predicted TIM-barrel fold metal-dependent hydrolase
MIRLNCGCTLTRRAALAGLGATLAAAALPARAATTGLIDVHHHLSPPDYVARIGKRTKLMPQVTDWTPEASLADMDQAGVATAVLSITTPGLWFGDVGEAREVARACNEYAAGLARRHPGRFGSFAALPMPDVDGSLTEIAYALDVLKADGIMMFTSYGYWLGDPRAAPVLEELNRRKAVLYTHPTSNACCVNLLPGIPDTVVEYGTDTTRTITSLLFSGATRRYPDIRFIFSHAGGTAPFLVERFRFLAASPANAGKFPDGVEAEMRRFYYDTAQAYAVPPMAALRALVQASQILFGTDYPYRTAAEHVAGLQRVGFTAAEWQAVGRGNAAGLLPRLAA